MSHDHIGERAPDAELGRRPGHRKEHEPRPVHRAHWIEPERQPEDGLEIFREPSRNALTATFGTQQQPKGLSGALRRRAYQVPDYRPSRWLLLIAADRLEKLETNLDPRKPRNWLFLAAGTSVGLGIYYYFRQRSRSVWG